MVDERFPILAGAEPWSKPGEGKRARIGVGVVHGFTGSPIAVRPLAEALAERGFSIEMPRLPGHGTHWRDMMRTRYADWLAEVERTVNALRERCEVVVLAGLSMGGTLVLDVASRHLGDVQAVASINAPMLDREGLLAKAAPLLEKLIPAVPAAAAGLAKNDIAKGGDEQAYGWVPAAAANSLLAALPRIRERLGALTIPVLVAWSRQDHSVPPENAQAILAALAKASSRELVLERSYHVATLDYDLPELVDAISQLADDAAAD